MLKNLSKKRKKKKGFTLIELIVVLAVLAIIAMIAIPNFNQIRENSKIKSDERGADLIDKSVTMLVQDGSITDKNKAGAVLKTKTVYYGFNTSGKLDVTGTDADFAEGEVKKIKDTIIDGKGPQSYDEKAVWKVEMSGLGGMEPKVSVKLFESKAEADKTGGKVIYDSNSGDAEVATTS